MPPSPPPQPPDQNPPLSLINNVQNAVAEIENRLSQSPDPTPQSTLTPPPSISQRVQHFERAGPLAMASFSTPPPPPPPQPTPSSPPTPSSSVASFVQHFENSSPTSSQVLTSQPESSKPIAPTVHHFESQTHHPPVSTNPPPTTPHYPHNSLASDTLPDSETLTTGDEKIATHPSLTFPAGDEALVSETEPESNHNQSTDAPSVLNRSEESLRGQHNEEAEPFQTEASGVQKFENVNTSHEENDDGRASENVAGMVAPVVEMFENPSTGAEEKPQEPLAGTVAPVVEMFENSSVAAEEDERVRATEDEGGRVAPVLEMFENPLSVDEKKSEGATAGTVAPIVGLFENSSAAAKEDVEASAPTGGPVLPVVEMFENLPAVVDEVVEKSETEIAGAVAPVVNMFETSSLTAKEEDVSVPATAVGSMLPAEEMFENLSREGEDKRQEARSATAVPVASSFEGKSMADEAEKVRVEASFEVAGAVAPVAEIVENAKTGETEKIEITLSDTVAGGPHENLHLTGTGDLGVQSCRTTDGTVVPAVDALGRQQCEEKSGAGYRDGADTSSVSMTERSSGKKEGAGETEEGSAPRRLPVTPDVGVISNTGSAESEESESAVGSDVNVVVDNSENTLDKYEHKDVEMSGAVSFDSKVSKNLQADEDLESHVSTIKTGSAEGDMLRNPRANYDASDRVAVQVVLSSGEELLENKLDEAENSSTMGAADPNSHSKDFLDVKLNPGKVGEVVDAEGDLRNARDEAEPSTLDEARNAEVEAASPSQTESVPEILSEPEELEESNVNKDTVSNIAHDFAKPQDAVLPGHGVEQSDLVAPVVDTIEIGTSDSEVQACDTNMTEQQDNGTSSYEKPTTERSAEALQTEEVDSAEGSTLPSSDGTARASADDDLVTGTCGGRTNDTGTVQLNSGTEYSKDRPLFAGKAEQVEISTAANDDQNSGDQLGADLKNVCIGRNAIGAEIFAESTVISGTINGGGKDLLATELPNHNSATADESDNKVSETPAESKPATVECPENVAAVSSDTPDRSPHPPKTSVPETTSAMPAIARSAEPQESDLAVADDKRLGLATADGLEHSSTDVPRTETEVGSTTGFDLSNEHQAGAIVNKVTSNDAAPAEGVSSGFEDLLAEAESLAVAGLSEDLKGFQTEISDFDESIPIVSGLGIDEPIPEAGISSEEARLLQALNAEIARMELSGRSVDEIKALSATEEEMYSTSRAPEGSAMTEGDRASEENNEDQRTNKGSCEDASAERDTVAVPHTISAMEEPAKSVSSGTKPEHAELSAVNDFQIESSEAYEGSGTSPARVDKLDDSKNSEEAPRDPIAGGTTLFKADSAGERLGIEKNDQIGLPTVQPAVESGLGLEQTQAPVRAREESSSETSISAGDQGEGKGTEERRVDTVETQDAQKAIDRTAGAADGMRSTPACGEPRIESLDEQKDEKGSPSTTDDTRVEVSPAEASIKGAPGTESGKTVEEEHPKKPTTSKGGEVLDASVAKQTSNNSKTPSKGRLSRRFGRQPRPTTSSTAVTPGKTEKSYVPSHFMRRSIASGERSSTSMSAKGMRKSPDARVVSAERSASSAGSRSSLRNSLPNARGQKATSTPLRERVGGIDRMSARLPRVADLSAGKGDKKLSRPRLQRGSTFTGTLPGSPGAVSRGRVGGKVEESVGAGCASGMAGILLSPSSSTASTPAKEVPKTPMLRRTMSFSHSHRGTSSGSSSVGARSPSPRPPFGSSSGRGGAERRSESPATGNVKRFDRRATTSVTGSAAKPPRSGGGGFRATVPRPFDLVGLEMHEKMQREIEERRKRIHESEQRRRAFKARPMPDFSRPSPRPKRNQEGT
eukprot:GFKZ01015949.1.p1 GENE.GFKZ01015949.1~~GFKZ01015949.1.p1  ORF type:complete len:1845 (+),score=314.10 GFKZ01015949.1:407-5941(+)